MVAKRVPKKKAQNISNTHYVVVAIQLSVLGIDVSEAGFSFAARPAVSIIQIGDNFHQTKLCPNPGGYLLAFLEALLVRFRRLLLTYL